MKTLGMAMMALFWISSQSANAAQIQSLQVKTQGNESVIEIVGEGLSSLVKEEKKSPPQLVLTFKDSSISEEAKQSFDPSAEASASPLIQVSAYPFSDSDARVVLDFKDSLKYKIEKSDRKITIHAPFAAEKKVALQAQAH